METDSFRGGTRRGGARGRGAAAAPAAAGGFSTAGGFGSVAPVSGFGGTAAPAAAVGGGFGGAPRGNKTRGGKKPKQAAGGFGTAATSSGGFGTAATSGGGFGTAATSSGGFGTAATSSGGFGGGMAATPKPKLNKRPNKQQQQAQPSGFGTATTPSGGFGGGFSTAAPQPAAASTGFGTGVGTGFGTMGGTGFGQPAAPTTTAFGAGATRGGFPGARDSTRGRGRARGSTSRGGGFGQPTATGFGQPTSTGFGQPASTGFGQPTTTGFGQPTSTGFGQPTTTGFGQPTTTGFGQPTTTGFGQPATTGFGQPTSTGFGQPASTGFGTGVAATTVGAGRADRGRDRERRGRGRGAADATGTMAIDSESHGFSQAAAAPQRGGFTSRGRRGTAAPEMGAQVQVRPTTRTQNDAISARGTRGGRGGRGGVGGGLLTRALTDSTRPRGGGHARTDLRQPQGNRVQRPAAQRYQEEEQEEEEEEEEEEVPDDVDEDYDDDDEHDTRETDEDDEDDEDEAAFYRQRARPVSQQASSSGGSGGLFAHITQRKAPEANDDDDDDDDEAADTTSRRISVGGKPQQQPAAPNTNNRTLWVKLGSAPFSTVPSVRKFFSKAGAIESIEAQGNKRHVFVTFETRAQAEAALKLNLPQHLRKSVSWAIQPRTSTPAVAVSTPQKPQQQQQQQPQRLQARAALSASTAAASRLDRGAAPASQSFVKRSSFAILQDLEEEEEEEQAEEEADEDEPEEADEEEAEEEEQAEEEEPDEEEPDEDEDDQDEPEEAEEEEAEEPVVAIPTSRSASLSGGGVHRPAPHEAALSLLRLSADPQWTTSYQPLGYSSASAIMGQCREFCPADEQAIREQTNGLHYFESENDGNGGEVLGGGGVAPRARRGWVIKDYKRSDAGKSEDAEAVRTPETLARTVQHMIDNVLDSNEKELWEIYTFANNRFRAVAMDFSIQHIHSRIKVEIIERITRFHILSAHRLCALEEDKFSSKQNRDRLNDLLGHLRYDYEILHQNGVACANEPEFWCYTLLFFFDLLPTMVPMVRADVLASPHVQLALACYTAFHEGNYVRFFKLVVHAPYLVGCLLHSAFYKVRLHALKVLNKAYQRQGFPVAEMRALLVFDTDRQASDFVLHHGIPIDAGTIQTSFSTITYPKQLQVLRPSKVIEKKVAGLAISTIVSSPMRFSAELNALLTPARTAASDTFSRSSTQSTAATIVTPSTSIKQVAKAHPAALAPSPAPGKFTLSLPASSFTMSPAPTVAPPSQPSTPMSIAPPTPTPAPISGAKPPPLSTPGASSIFSSLLPTMPTRGATTPIAPPLNFGSGSVMPALPVPSFAKPVVAFPQPPSMTPPALPTPATPVPLPAPPISFDAGSLHRRQSFKTVPVPVPVPTADAHSSSTAAAVAHPERVGRGSPVPTELPLDEPEQQGDDDTAAEAAVATETTDELDDQQDQYDDDEYQEELEEEEEENEVDEYDDAYDGAILEPPVEEQYEEQYEEQEEDEETRAQRELLRRTIAEHTIPLEEPYDGASEYVSDISLNRIDAKKLQRQMSELKRKARRERRVLWQPLDIASVCYSALERANPNTRAVPALYWNLLVVAPSSSDTTRIGKLTSASRWFYRKLASLAHTSVPQPQHEEGANDDGDDDGAEKPETFVTEASYSIDPSDIVGYRNQRQLARNDEEDFDDDDDGYDDNVEQHDERYGDSFADDAIAYDTVNLGGRLLHLSVTHLDDTNDGVVWERLSEREQNAISSAQAIVVLLTCLMSKRTSAAQLEAQRQRLQHLLQVARSQVLAGVPVLLLYFGAARRQAVEAMLELPQALDALEGDDTADERICVRAHQLHTSATIDKQTVARLEQAVGWCAHATKPLPAVRKRTLGSIVAQSISSLPADQYYFYTASLPKPVLPVHMCVLRPVLMAPNEFISTFNQAISRTIQLLERHRQTTAATPAWRQMVEPSPDDGIIDLYDIDSTTSRGAVLDLTDAQTWQQVLEELEALQLPLLETADFSTPRACVATCMSYLNVVRDSYAPECRTDEQTFLWQSATEQLYVVVRDLMLQFLLVHTAREDDSNDDNDEDEDDDDEERAFSSRFKAIFPWHLVFNAVIAWRLATIDATSHQVALLNHVHNDATIEHDEQEEGGHEFVSLSELLADLARKPQPRRVVGQHHHHRAPASPMNQTTRVPFATPAAARRASEQSTTTKARAAPHTIAQPARAQKRRLQHGGAAAPRALSPVIKRRRVAEGEHGADTEASAPPLPRASVVATYAEDEFWCNMLSERQEADDFDQLLEQSLHG